MDRSMSSPKKTADLLLDFWDQATKVISLPRVKELEAELRGRDKEIARLQQELKDTEKYKIAWELNK